MPTLAQYKRVHSKDLDAELSGQWSFLGGQFNHTDFVISFPGGSWIRIVSAEQRNTLAGIRCDTILADECDDLEIQLYDSLCAPWMTETHSLALALFGGTPRRGRYGLLYREHRAALDGKAKQFSFHASSYEFENVSRDFVEGQRQILDPALFAREYLCDFDSAEGLVYSMFEESFHRRSPDKRTAWTEFLVGVDHGWEDPGVFLLIGVAGSGADATCHVVKEIYATKQTEDWWKSRVPLIIAEAKKLSSNAEIRWYCDPSRPDRIEALRKAGASIREANNAIEDGVACVANRLAIRKTNDDQHFAKLYVDPSCSNLIREMGMYKRKRDPRNKDRILDDIADRDNHATDALRYPIFTRFGPNAPQPPAPIMKRFSPF